MNNNDMPEIIKLREYIITHFPDTEYRIRVLKELEEIHNIIRKMTQRNIDMSWAIGNLQEGLKESDRHVWR